MSMKNFKYVPVHVKTATKTPGKLTSYMVGTYRHMTEADK
jgi:hypothetical protein